VNYVPKGGNEALAKRLDKAITRLESGQRPLYGSDDYAVFCYVRKEIEPEVIAKHRREDDTNLGKLHAAAGERLAHYEREDQHG
jgi:hypothetical protein